MSSNEHCYVTNFGSDVDRIFLKSEFSKFGEIRKIFLENSGKFAKVYFHDSKNCVEAVDEFKQNLLGWNVVFQKDSDSFNRSTNSSLSSFDHKVKKDNMYYNNRDDFDVQEPLDEFVNVHGKEVDVLMDDSTNEMYVRLRDVEEGGFAIFKRSEISCLTNKERNSIKEREFDMHLLNEAGKYLIKHSLTIITHEHILETIAKCKEHFLSSESAPSGGPQQHHRDRRSVNINVDRQRDNRRSTAGSGEKLQRAKSATRIDRNEGYQQNFDEQPMRPPKTLPGNFGPTHMQRFATQTLGNNSRPPRHNNRDDGFTENERLRGQPTNNRRDNRHQRNDDFEKNQKFGEQQNNSFAKSGGYQRNNRRDDNFEEQQNNSFAKSGGYQKTNRRGDDFEKSQIFGEQQNNTFAKSGGPQRNFQNARNSQSDSHSQISDNSTQKKKSLLKSLERVDEISKVCFDVGKTYKVRISNLEKEKDNICWVQDTEMSSDVDDLLIELNDAAEDLDITTVPTRGQLGIAVFEDVWCRCRVVNLNPLNVFFIDYGNRADVSEVKDLPEKFRKAPAYAVRLVISRNSISLENEMELDVRVINKYDDDTCLVEASQSANQESNASIQRAEPAPIEASQESSSSSPTKRLPDVSKIEEVPKQKTPQKPPSDQPSEPPQISKQYYFDMPNPIGTLKDGDKVMLLGREEDRFIVKTKEGVQKSKEILEYIKTLNKTELMLDEVKEGQLVLCSKDGLPNLCRGVVEKKESASIAVVKYLDYVESDTLSIKSLRNVDQHLAGEPLTKLLTPEIGILSRLSDTSVDFIQNLFDNKEKAKVVITEDNDFDLQLEGGIFLSQKLAQLEKAEKEIEVPLLVPVISSTPNARKSLEMEKPASKPVQESPRVAEEAPKVSPNKEVQASEGPVSYNDMPYITAEVGSSGRYICYTITDFKEITLIATTDESVAYMERVSDLEIDDDTPYEPKIMDMCVVSYKPPEDEEPSWHRAVVLDKEAKGYLLSAVDFGIQITAPSKDIRRFPARLKEIPILGILCSLADIPESEKNLKRVKELLTEGDEVTVKINEFLEDELKYVIEIPEVYKTLRKEGILKG